MEWSGTVPLIVPYALGIGQVRYRHQYPAVESFQRHARAYPLRPIRMGQRTAPQRHQVGFTRFQHCGAFETAARLGSFKRAAEELGVTPTAVSHQIRALEEQVGVPLFDRQIRKVALTHAGRELLPVLRESFDAMAATLQRLSGANARALVTISATRAFTAKWLLPRLPDFRDAHPHIDLRLHAADEAIDLRSVDIAIRYGRGPYPGSLAEPLLTDRFAPMANPRLAVASISDLARVPLIEFDWKHAHPDNATWQRWFSMAGLQWPTSARVLRLSDESHAIQAAVAGHGVAMLSQALISDELREGHLTQPFESTLPSHTYHLVTNATRTPSTDAVAVAAWLRSHARN